MLQGILLPLHLDIQPIQHVVDALDVSMDICAKGDRVTKGMEECQPKLLAGSLKVQLYSEAPVLSQGNRIGALHVVTLLQDSGAGCFLLCKTFISDNHGGKAIRIRFRVFIPVRDVLLIPLNHLLRFFDLSWIVERKIVLYADNLITDGQVLDMDHILEMKGLIFQGLEHEN